MVLSDIEVRLSTKRVSKLSLVESNARKSINLTLIRDLREEYIYNELIPTFYLLYRQSPSLSQIQITDNVKAQ